jgi:hypothetical protein
MVDAISATNKISDRQMEKEYWKEKNKICMQCINKCKQSSKVSVLSCTKYVIKQTQGV